MPRTEQTGDRVGTATHHIRPDVEASNVCSSRLVHRSNGQPATSLVGWDPLDPARPPVRYGIPPWQRSDAVPNVAGRCPTRLQQLGDNWTGVGNPRGSHRMGRPTYADRRRLPLIFGVVGQSRASKRRTEQRAGDSSHRVGLYRHPGLSVLGNPDSWNLLADLRQIPAVHHVTSAARPRTRPSGDRTRRESIEKFAGDAVGE